MSNEVQLPPKRQIALATAGAIVSVLSASSAQADCVSGGTVAASTNGNVNWSSGNCAINTSIVVSDFFQQTALISSSSVGTLTNSGTLSGFRYGVLVSGTVGAIVNNATGLITGESVSGVGLLNNGNIGTLTNNGKITSGSSGLRNAGTIGTIINSGRIIGSGGFGYTPFRGIDNLGTITLLNNLAGGTISGGSQGVFNSGIIGTLNNSGTITVANGPDLQGVLNSGGGTIGLLSNNAGGSISGNTGVGNSSGRIMTLTNNGIITGAQYGVQNSGTIDTLTNNGSISGSTAIGITGTLGTLTNSATGVISGSGIGLSNTGTIASLANSGNITALVGIVNGAGGTITSLVNNGTINGSGIGSAIGVNNSGNIASLANNGTITADTAIRNAGAIGTILNTGLIAGNIINTSSNALNISGVSGLAQGTLTGLGGAIGSISSTSANVNFTGGNLLLNDNLNVGSNTVNNSGAVLRINNIVNITGNYQQSAGATLLVGVADTATSSGTTSDTGYGRLVVSGSANVAAGSGIVLQKTNAYAFAAGQRFVVIDAATSGTNYNASSLNYSAVGVTGLTVSGATVVNGANSDLVVSLSNPSSGGGSSGGGSSGGDSSGGSTPTASGATVPNASSALSGLGRYTGISNAGLLNLYNASMALNASGSTADLNRAGKQLSPNTQAPSGRTAAAPTYDVLNIISRRSDGLRLSQGQGQNGVSTGEGPPQWGLWGQAFGGHANQSQRDQIDGYSADYGGALIGLDRDVGHDWRLGGVFSYSSATARNDGDTNGDNTRINSYGLFGYGSYVAATWYANVSAGIVKQNYSTTRTIDFTGFSGSANGSFSGQQYVARGEVGYPIVLSNFTVTPLASLTYSYLKQDAYTESGGNGAALSVDSSHTTSVSSDIGAKFEKEFVTSAGNLVPEIRLAWRHEYDNTRVRTTANFAGDPTGASSFTTLGASPVKDSALFSLGLTLLKANDLSVTVRYEAQVGGGYRSQAGSLRLRQLF